MNLPLSQKNRLLSIQSSETILSQFIPVNFTAEEGLSKLFCVEIHGYCTCLERNPKDWLGQSVTLKINDGNLQRYFHGYVAEVWNDGVMDRGIRRYGFALRPQVWFLGQIEECQIYQNKTIPEIIQSIAEQFGLQNLSFSKLCANYPSKKHVAQYNESTLHFLLRILEAAGIHYYFEHGIDNHKWYLLDNLNRLPKLPQKYCYQNERSDGVYIYNWKHCASLTATLQHQFSGKSNGLNFSGGFQFQLLHSELPAESGQYCLLKVKHEGYDYSYTPKPIKSLAAKKTHGHISRSYFNRFQCTLSVNRIVANTCYSKPKIVGHHLATVVGPKQGIVHTDKLGRIQVKMPWDKIGPNHSLIWIPILQKQSGHTWGKFAVPRVGQEVLIAYENDDIDSPICLGANYNTLHRPPFTLPEEQHVSGIKTKSIAEDGVTDHHELSFHDLLGHEKIKLLVHNEFNENMEGHVNLTIHGYHKEDHHSKHIASQKTVQIISEKQLTFISNTTKITVTPNKIILEGKSINLG